MIDTLYNLGILSGIVFFCTLIAIFSIAIYLITNYLVKDKIAKSHERMGKVLFRSAASLLALILSFTFANERVSYFTLKSTIESEASKLVDIHLDLSLLNTSEAHEIQLKVRDYIVSITEDGWLGLFDDPFASRQVKHFLDIYHALNHLPVANEFEKRVKGNLLSDIDEVSDYLQGRIYSTRGESAHLIYTSFFGLTVIMILFAVYPPDKLTLGFLSIYVIFIGVVLYFILMMSAPLKGTLQIEPGPFIILKDKIEAMY